MSTDELKPEPPGLIVALWALATQKIPLGSGMINGALARYPEYFTNDKGGVRFKDDPWIIAKRLYKEQNPDPIIFHDPINKDKDESKEKDRDNE